MVSDRIAIIHKGRIIQIGTPHEIYENPKNLFVCRFISNSNFLEGVIEDIKDDGSIIKLSDDRTIKISRRDFPIHEKVVAAVRSENISIIGGKNLDIPNSVSGIVETSKFVSGNSIEEVRLDTGELFTTLRHATKDWFEEGDRVTLFFEPERALLFTYPEEGLKEALDVF